MVDEQRRGVKSVHIEIYDIGDIFLHFTELASDYSLEEPTVMQKTKL